MEEAIIWRILYSTNTLYILNYYPSLGFLDLVSRTFMLIKSNSVIFRILHTKKYHVKIT